MKPSVDFPRFPKIPYLFQVQSTTSNDIIATSLDWEAAKIASTMVIEEKLDGANVRIMFDGNNEPIVGNREHILKKGYLKNTPAKLQFRPLWTWVYDHRGWFAKLAEILGGTPVVFGEWLYARHTIHYDQLPELFIPFDLYLAGQFLDPVLARGFLREAGFTNPPLGPAGGQFGVAAWSPEIQEGVVIKHGDGQKTLAWFKNVRPDFMPRKDFTTKPLERNELMK